MVAVTAVLADATSTAAVSLCQHATTQLLLWCAGSPDTHQINYCDREWVYKGPRTNYNVQSRLPDESCISWRQTYSKRQGC
jgi:hypothetical protein